MRRRSPAITWLLLLVPCVASSAQAPGPRVGLVLSGGAAKGIAHVGVLQVLEEAGVRVDVITGTSMGALVGGLYAIGYGADSLAGIARTIPWDVVFSNRTERRYLQPEQKLADERHLATLPIRGITPTLPNRLIDGHNVRQLLARLTWPAALARDFRTLPIPFAAVAADLETGEAVVFDSGPLVDALSATMAIPGVFAPEELSGRTLVDGGIVRNLPAQDAEALGADVLVCSDVSQPPKQAEELTTVLAVVDQALSLKFEPAHREEVARCDILITPDIEGLTGLDFRATEAWIARGRAAAERVRPALDSLATLARRTGAPVSPAGPRDRRIDALTSGGIDSAHARVVRRRMNLALPADLGAGEIAEAMDRLQAAGDFDRVAYTLEPTADSGARIVVRAGGTGPATLGIGARYEGKYKASLLFTGRLHDRLGVGSVATVDLRLGEQLRAAGGYERRLGAVTPWAFRARGGYDRVPVDLYSNGVRTAAARMHVLDASAFFGVAGGTAALIGITAQAEYARTVVTTGLPGDTTQEDARTFYTVGAEFTVDTRDARTLARTGVFADGRTVWADPAIGSGATFRQHVLRTQAAIPLGPILSVLLRADVGVTTGNDVPPHYRFYLGGAVPYYMLPDRHLPFLGLRLQEQSGRYVQVAGAGVQARLPADVFLQLSWNGGSAMEAWALDPGAWIHGAGVSLAWRSTFGTASAHLSGETFDGPYRLELDLGFAF